MGETLIEMLLWIPRFWINQASDSINWRPLYVNGPYYLVSALRVNLLHNSLQWQKCSTESRGGMLENEAYAMFHIVNSKSLWQTSYT